MNIHILIWLCKASLLSNIHIWLQINLQILQDLPKILELAINDTRLMWIHN